MIETMEELNSFLNKRETLGIKPGLHRIKHLLMVYDQPEKKMLAIHVAGTNGKGSTVAFLANTLQRLGYRVGTFTSPSLATRNEMIQVNGEPISDQALFDYFSLISAEINQLDQAGDSPSPFEIIVAIAFKYLHDHADIAIIETGMGGKEDATNVLSPLISIITTIGLDHKQFLGDSYASIASHKAGIIKQNTPVIIGDLPEEANRVIKQYAVEQDAPLYQLGKAFIYTKIEDRYYHFAGLNHDFAFTLAMKGSHQAHNASIAIATLLQLQAKGYAITEEMIATALSDTKITGRFEQVTAHSPTIIVDGAHNTESIEAFVQTVQQNYPNQEKQLIFAAFKDKPVKEMIKRVDPVFDCILFTSFDHPRAAKATELFTHSNNPNKQFIENWEEVVDQVLRQEMTTFITGSMDFIGKVSKRLRKDQ